jgi:16S rRNA (guanine966-N2)-methyltransferase
MRITGGIYRSRTLRAPRGVATRPTSDRVREGLFGILGSAGAVEGARVLDLYAGTGALGLESLSRGASHATFVERADEALAAIRANVTALRLEGQALVMAADVARGIRRIAARGPFDLVLCDPPWALVEAGDAPRALESLVAAGGLADDGVVVLEHGARAHSPDLAGLLRTETRRYGDTALAIYKPAILGPPRPDHESPTPG